jgi:uncharacterized membrane protein YhaH (DUF805 family)
MDIKQAVIRCVRDKYADFSGRAGRAEYWYFVLVSVLLGVVLQALHLNLIGVLVNLGLIVPSIAAGARRLHDTGKSGWFQLVMLIPLVGWLLLAYWCAQPSVGPNQYGEGPASAEAPGPLPPETV